jgi:hypothetical protein
MAKLYVLTRSLARAEKERAMRQRVLKGLRKDLAKLSHAVRSGRIYLRELRVRNCERRAKGPAVRRLKIFGQEISRLSP